MLTYPGILYCDLEIYSHTILVFLKFLLLFKGMRLHKAIHALGSTSHTAL